MIIMHMASEARTTRSLKRRFYSPKLKLQVVNACGEADASFAAVALQRGTDANIVCRCLREHSQGTLICRQQTSLLVTPGAYTEPSIALTRVGMLHPILLISVNQNIDLDKPA